MCNINFFPPPPILTTNSTVIDYIITQFLQMKALMKKPETRKRLIKHLNYWHAE